MYKRRDHARFLLGGFAFSLLLGMILFAVTAFSTIRESRKLLQELQNHGPAQPANTASQEENGEDPKNAAQEEQTEGTENQESEEAEAPSESAAAPEETPGASEEAVQTASPDFNDGTIRRLSDEELWTIENTVDTTVRGFGTGFDQPKDDFNRNAYVVSVQDDLSQAGINGRCFCADENTKRIAITFQAGYDNGYTEQILDILKAQGIKSTFYITHEFAWSRPDIVQRIIDEGHAIGSHTYSAPEEGIAYLSLREQMEDALQMQQYMDEKFGYSMRKYNYNSGVWSLASAKMMSDMGYQLDFCSVNYDDYDPEVSYEANKILDSLLSCGHNGAVYCFHMTNPITAEILPGLIHYLKVQGYELVQMP